MPLFEINTRIHCRHFDEITDDEFHALSSLGFDAVWLMGAWRISDGARRVSKVCSREFDGSPYAVPQYEINPDLGGLAAFRDLVERAHRSGIAVILDFVSNHLALDSPLIDQNPSYFMLSNPEVRKQNVSDYFLHASGEMVAFGRDPYFPPWSDTAQLDYTNPELRAGMIDTLKWIATIADGVRCDMAMLVLRDQIRRQWYPLVSDEWFEQRMPHEFWEEAWSEVKKSHPGFIAIAEVYWDKEEYLVQLGFDYCYEKKLYDALVARDAARVRGKLRASTGMLARSLFFIENHDEDRAASIFNSEENLAAAALILALPGLSLIHEGQMQGFRRRIPVQVSRLLDREAADQKLQAAYERLLAITSFDVFRKGKYEPFDTGIERIVGFIRQDSERLVAYLGQVGDLPQRFAETPVDLSSLFRAANTGHSIRITNLVNPEIDTLIECCHLIPGVVMPGVGLTDRFILIEATAADR